MTPKQRRRRPALFPHNYRWDAALADFTDTMGRRKLAASTLARICKHLRTFAAEVDRPPYDVTHEHIAAWLDSLTCSTQAKYGYRTSLRTFYRWAHGAGRVPDDPTGSRAQHPLAKPVPAGWNDPLAAFDRWIRASNYSLITAELYRHKVSALARETGAPSPWHLSTSDLTDWIAGHRWSRETIRSNRTAVRTFYRWAHEAGHIDHDPAAQLPKAKPGTPRPRPATEAVYRQAIAAADERTALMLRLAGDLGLRRAEVAKVHTNDLEEDPELGIWWLHILGKGDKPRRLPLTDGLAAAIRDAGPGYIFPGAIDGHLSPAHVGVLMGKALPPGVTAHTLRHRFATRAYSIDRDVFTVQQLLGHASAETTQRYVQTDGAAMHRLVKIVAG